MKKFALLLSIVLVFSLFSPSALAVETLGKPSEGQVIFTEADNTLEYRADFPLSALTGAFRDGDDLRLEFPAARLTLRGFFIPLGEWRSLVFSDGSSIGGADFDSEGSYTGKFHSVLDQGKGGQNAKLSAAETGAKADVVAVRISPYGTEVYIGGEDTWGEMRDKAIQAVALLSPVEKPDWSIVTEQRYEFTADKDGSLRPLRAYTDFSDGISTETVNPGRVYLSRSLSMQPVSAGRASVSFTNRQGKLLLQLDVLCTEDEVGGLRLECRCDGCGEILDGNLHFLPCGHYSCAENFNAAEHGLAPCQVAGHCISEDGHDKCSNCLEYVCDGKSHGVGVCEHVHNWTPISLVASRCTSCGYVYTRK